MRMLSVVIPTINSANRIEKTVNYIDNFLKKNKDKLNIKDYEIIIASQTSDDNTFDVIKKIASKNKRVVPLFLKKRGKA